jgi:hypothetical protein
MKTTIHLDIGASHLRATRKPGMPGWGRRVVRAVGDKLGRVRSPVLAKEIAASAITEIASWTPGATRSETITSLVEAGAQTLQALRARHPASLDGCRLTVRTGVSTSYVGIVPMDFSSPSARSDAQLHIVAKAVSQEAMGTDAAGHALRWNVQADQTHLCVITLESALVAGLQTLAQAQRMKLASCQPVIVELLESELKQSRQRPDARTLMWTESEASGQRHPTVTFVRLVNGSAVNAWRTVTPSPSANGDPWLRPALERFLIASGAAQDEQVIPCGWPAQASDSAPAAATELAA